MINRTTLAGLAAVTFVLFIASAAMGQDFGEGNAFLWTLADIVWVSFLLCALALLVMTVAVLVRARTRSRH
jgi:nicotinamide riboside transporter PnuC